jgi:hypothetical protein
VRLILDDSGLSNADKLAILNQLQGGRCAVCRAGGQRLVGDHDHDTGLLRGLICHSCNLREGQMRWHRSYHEDILAYLANPPAACFGWMWQLPDWWKHWDDIEVTERGLTARDYALMTYRTVLAHLRGEVTPEVLAMREAWEREPREMIDAF